MTKRPPKDWHEPFLKELAKDRTANKAAASVGIKGDTAYRRYKKDAASLAKRWHKRESKKVKRVNHVPVARIQQ